MKEAICVIGAGGHARSVINLLRLNTIALSGVFDNSYDKKKKELIAGIPLKGAMDDFPPHAKIVLAVGDNKKRHALYKQFKDKVLKKNILHPSAIIEEATSLGEANLIFAGAYLNTEAKIGDNNIINSHAVLEHEVIVGSHNHISVGAVLCGRVSIGNQCFIGAGATVIDKIKITDGVTVGANAVVVKDICQPGIYVGNPARKIS